MAWRTPCVTVYQAFSRYRSADGHTACCATRGLLGLLRLGRLGERGDLFQGSLFCLDERSKAKPSRHENTPSMKMLIGPASARAFILRVWRAGERLFVVKFVRLLKRVVQTTKDS